MPEVALFGAPNATFSWLPKLTKFSELSLPFDTNFDTRKVLLSLAATVSGVLIPLFALIGVTQFAVAVNPCAPADIAEAARIIEKSKFLFI